MFLPACNVLDALCGVFLLLESCSDQFVLGDNHNRPLAASSRVIYISMARCLPGIRPDISVLISDAGSADSFVQAFFAVGPIDRAPEAAL